MKFIKIASEKSIDEVRKIIKDNDRVNSGVQFADKKGGKPFMHIKEGDGGKLKIKCEMIGRPTKDNGFLMGTTFYGKIREKNGQAVISGTVITSPIYHAIVIILAAVLLIQGILSSSIGFIPVFVFAIAFEFMFFTDEFKKQGYIERYLIRALRRLDEGK